MLRSSGARKQLTAEYDAELTLLHVLEEVASPAKTEEAIATARKELDKLIPRFAGSRD